MSSHVKFEVEIDPVDNSQMAQMPASTIKGNNTGSAADPQDLSPAQVAVMMGISELNPSPTYPLDMSGVGVGCGFGTVQASFSGAGNEAGILIENTYTNGGKFSILATGLSSGLGWGKFVIADVTGGVRLCFDHAGNCGINNYSPAYGLDVVGTGNFSGALSAASLAPANGASGSFVSADSKTITVANGIITSIV